MKNFTVLGISGSPRIAATDYVINYALDLIKEKEKAEILYFSVAKKKINFCIHCDYCIKNKKGCIHKDDMQDLYPLMEKADAWIIGTPIYQGSVSAQIKAILDRCRAPVAKNLKVFENKVGAAIGIGGDRLGGQEIAIQTILNFYIINEMIPVGGGSFGANLGGTVWSKDKKAQGAAEDEEGKRSIRKMVKRLVSTVKMIKNIE
ncbi:MAG: flavodoxin family protein [Candidatus Helarchaeota archaeon]|nr:flavodoxin family protein [Candidatus Helarchaeota archaeon]